MPPLPFLVAVLAALDAATLFPAYWILGAKVLCGEGSQSDIAITLRHNLKQQLGLNSLDAEAVQRFSGRHSAVDFYDHALRNPDAREWPMWPKRTVEFMSQGKKPALPDTCYGVPELFMSSPAAARGSIIQVASDGTSFYSSVGYAVGLTGRQVRKATASFVKERPEAPIQSSWLEGEPKSSKLRIHIGKGKHAPHVFLRGLSGFAHADRTAGEIVATMLGAYISVDAGLGESKVRGSSFGDPSAALQIMLRLRGAHYSIIDRNIPWRSLSETTALLRCPGKAQHILNAPRVGPHATGVGAVWQLMAAAERRALRSEGKNWAAARTPSQIYSELVNTTVSKKLRTECPLGARMDHVLAGLTAGTVGALVVEEELVHLDAWATQRKVAVSVYSPPSRGAPAVHVVTLGRERGTPHSLTRPELKFVVDNLVDGVDMLADGVLHTDWQLLEEVSPLRGAVFRSEHLRVMASGASLARAMLNYFAPLYALPDALAKFGGYNMSLAQRPTVEEENAVVAAILPPRTRVELFQQEKEQSGHYVYEHLTSFGTPEADSIVQVVHVGETKPIIGTMPSAFYVHELQLLRDSPAYM